jgi:competence protein ComEA
VARVTDSSGGDAKYTGVADITVPSTLKERIERVAGRRRDLWIAAALVVAVALGALLLFSRSRPARVAPPAVAGVAPTPALAPATPTPMPPSAEGLVLVHVAGQVRRPGLYELATGARVADALKAAGGPTRRAELDAINLAEAVNDGLKLDVPARGEGVSSLTSGPVPTAASSPAVVNINTADGPALETIPGVGPVTAAAILEYRARIGSFTAIEQLLEVSGIGPVTLENIRPYVSL